MTSIEKCRAQPKYRATSDARGVVERADDAASGLEHILEVRLNNPSRHNLCLVADLERCTEATDWPEVVREAPHVAVEAARTLADSSIDEARTEFVVGTAWHHPCEHDAAVGPTID